MKYLRIFEEFDTWEKITADQWFSSNNNMENQPFNETEYDTLVNLCVDNANYKKGGNKYELDYDYINPNKMGYGSNDPRPNNGGRDWKFTILKYELGGFRSGIEYNKVDHTTLILFKKKESKDSNSLYFLSCEDHNYSKELYFECDRFEDLFGLIKKHLEL